MKFPLPALAAATFFPILALASPRIGSDSILARHDLLLLRDNGAIESSVSTWPWPLGRVAPDFESISEDFEFAESVERYESNYGSESRLGFRPLEASLSVASESMPFRSYGYQPREQIEFGGAVSWLSEWTAGKLQLTFADEPADGDDLRLDGSYFGIALGNWVAAIDQVDRWWGPGWDGSLILSNNARPVPALSLTRISPDAFENKWLRWIGPWTFTTFMGQLDNDEGDRPGSDARLFGMRIDFTPFGWKNLDIGLSRTAQWAGDGRPGDFSTFWHLLKGEDNAVNGVTNENEPGNQLAGVDYRLRIPGWNLAQYGQAVGEDEETFLPDAIMLLFGLETWGEFSETGGSWRLYWEWADTRAGYLRRDPTPSRDFNTAYNHGIYRTGYRRKGQAIGHAMDGDGVMRSMGGFITQANGNLWGFKYRNYAINRDGRGPHTISIDPLEGQSLEFFGELAAIPFAKAFKIEGPGSKSGSKIRFGIHHIDEENQRTGVSEDDFGGYVSILRQF